MTEFSTSNYLCPYLFANAIKSHISLGIYGASLKENLCLIQYAAICMPLNCSVMRDGTFLKDDVCICGFSLFLCRVLQKETSMFLLALMHLSTVGIKADVVTQQRLFHRIFRGWPFPQLTVMLLWLEMFVRTFTGLRFYRNRAIKGLSG